LVGSFTPAIMRPSNKNTNTKHKTTNQTLQEELKMKKVMKSKSSKKGFNLVELICVIAIICILAAAVGFNYLKIVKNLPWEEIVGENPFTTSAHK
jgi:prepilin-type N-terminal cleavage/methylation domain-containing protein